MCVFVAQACPTLCNPMESSPPSSSVHGIFQARILEWIAIAFSGGSSWPWDQNQVSCIVGSSLPSAKRETKDSKIICSVAQSCLTLWTAAHQAYPSFTISRSLLKLMSIESVMPAKVLNYGQWVYQKKWKSMSFGGEWQF